VPGADHYHYDDDSHYHDLDEHDLDFDEHNLDFDNDAYVPTGLQHPLHRRHSVL
jgi:hypothetical protein